MAAAPKFTRTINVSGNRTINNKEVNFNMNYTAGIKPDQVSFSVSINDMFCSGSITEAGLTNYSVNNGVFDDGILESIVTEGQIILKNYETV